MGKQTIIVAPNAFKESLSAREAAAAIATGIRRILPDADIVEIPVADGGNGTIDALTFGRRARFNSRTVAGPLPRQRVRARFALIDGGTTAVIESAEACGLHLVPRPLRDPLATTSRGVGELVLHAIDRGARDILIGLGGTATVDGGVGMAMALGVRFLDDGGHPISEGSGNLTRLATIDVSSVDRRIRRCRLTTLADVDNILCGPTGAAAVFGPQKGATPRDALILDRGLRRLAVVIRRDLHRNILGMRGGGAAGGIGAMLAAVRGARVVDGAEVILRRLDFRRRIARADLVVTGEGSVDHTTLRGKAPAHVIRAARNMGIPVALIAGTSSLPKRAPVVSSLTTLTDLAGSQIRALREPKRYLRLAAAAVARKMFVEQ